MKNTRTQPSISRSVAGILCGFALAGIGQAASSAILYYDFESSTDNLAIAGGITDQSTTGNDATAGTRGTGSAPTFSTSNGLTHSTGSLSFTGNGVEDGGIVTSTGNFSITGLPIASHMAREGGHSCPPVHRHSIPHGSHTSGQECPDSRRADTLRRKGRAQSPDKPLSGRANTISNSRTCPLEQAFVAVVPGSFPA